MATRKINLEFKHRRLDLPLLREIVGAHVSTDADEVIIRCLSATRDAREAVQDYAQKGIKITLVERKLTP
ncbi:hypothetical protein [Nostoc sp. 'Peltigera malacea cyanobiont' DB3992]|uniref:hypothetical protein n=1 Tax=Nostoc sp. 'Peltigera malacea cyanobiont' DB3992 TaxID=1206980 RepID=UPI000C042C60|nr:hypothetical protein [Nostoc sp. 'Peltigera malacea cyanobiont' DB3992]PHM07625.1 hypothetical protein CK516_25915 [Nostoc sp. 'Peltigera malacea cyanobiont' DB3992]